MLLVGLLVAAVALPASATAVPKARLSATGFGLPTGPDGGHISAANSRGLAVNLTGNGGVPAGTVYEVDGNPNNRIQQFTASGQFVRTWGLDVIKTGAANDNGTGFEICDTTTTPANVATDCKAGAAVGPAAGQLAQPVAIAVDQSNGYVYVSSNTNRRIDVFSATGRFAGAFGWGVRTGAAALEVCTTTCVTSAPAGAQAGNLSAVPTNAGSVAIDPNVPGRFFVADGGNMRVAQYDTTITSGALAAATFDRAFGWNVDPAGGTGFEVCTTATGCQAGTAGGGAGQFASGAPSAVAVDSDSALYVVSTASTCAVETPCRVQKFSADLATIQDFGPATGAGQLLNTSGVFGNQIEAVNVAVDPSSDHVFVTRKGDTGPDNSKYRILEYDKTGAYVETHPSGVAFTGNASLGTGLAIGTADRLYTSYGPVNTGIFILGPVPDASSTISPVTAVGTSTATFSGSVVVPAPGQPDFITKYHFEYSANGQTWSRFPADDQNAGDGNAGPQAVSDVVTGLPPCTTFLARLVTTTGNAGVPSTNTTSFTTGCVAPSVEQTYADAVSQTEAQLAARIDPQGAATTYHFDWGPTTAYGSRVPAFERSLGDGNSTVLTMEQLAGLTPASTYHFRVVATNATGTTTGPDQVLNTLNAAGLTGSHGYELVSPAVKGAGDYVGTIPLITLQLDGFPARDGQSYLYPLALGLRDSTAGGDLRYLATRRSTGWQSVQATPTSGSFSYVSDDLSCRVLRSRDRLSPDAPTGILEAGGSNLYRQNLDGTYTALNPEATRSGVPSSTYQVLGASRDCSRIVFQTRYTFAGIPQSGVYEWDAGTVSSVAVLPDGSVGRNATGGSDLPSATGGGWGSIQNAVSDDGSRIFFTATSNDGSDAGKLALYVRQDGSSSVKVSASTTGVADQGAVFQAASTDGSHVLFLANYGLTATTSAGATTADCTAKAGPPAACDLYDYDVDTGHLTDLSADAADAGGARVGGVLGLSDAAAYVYFAAQGQLVPGEGSTAAQNASASTYNVYLRHGGDLRYVGQIGQGQITDSGATMLTQRQGRLSSQTTPDGRSLLFASMANMTDYDSGGVNEAYLYSADTGATVCVSCRRDGQPSIDAVRAGALPAKTVSPLPLPLRYSMKDENGLPGVRAISDDGTRVFFSSADPLAAGAVSGKANVYVWQGGQITLLGVGPDGHLVDDRAVADTAFRGASASGDDAFLLTQQRLVSQDTDDQIDLYDVRVNGGFAAMPPPPAPCDPLADACQGAGTAPSPLNLGTFGPGSANAPSRPSPTLSLSKLSASQRRSLASSGHVTLTVQASVAGRLAVSASAVVAQRVRSVATASRTLTAAGTAHVRLTLSHAARAQLSRAGKLTVKVSVSHSLMAATQTATWKLVKAKAKKKAGKKHAAVKKAGRQASVPVRDDAKGR